jgi:hypothetical protein
VLESFPTWYQRKLNVMLNEILRYDVFFRKMLRKFMLGVRYKQAVMQIRNGD